MIAIGRALVDAIVDHARAALPNECCGLLVGEPGRIDDAVRTPNLKASPTAFLIDPSVHFATLRKARAEGRQIVGAYHSHIRSPAVPSASDIRESHDPEFVHVIVSLAEAEPVVRAFRIAQGGFQEIAVAIA